MTVNFTTWIIVALILSATANVVAFWYIRKLLTRFLFISQNLSDLVEVIKVYRNHIKSIYSLEMYYGDETLKKLISHTVSLSELLEDYEDIYSITEPLLEEDDEEEIYGEQIDAEETNSQEKDVLYAGSRKRDP